MPISASIQPTLYSDIIASMRSYVPWSAPRGIFYQLQGNIVPYSPNPTILKIETNRIGEPILIEVAKSSNLSVGVDPRKQTQDYTVVASSGIVTTGIQLGRGQNFIKVSVIGRPEEVAYLIVRATTIVALWEAFARVLYQASLRIIQEQQNAVSSKLATRLIEPFISFQNLLPDIQSLQILSTRLVGRGLIHHVGTDSGVSDLLKALSLTTPVYSSMDKDTFEVYPALDPWANTASQFAGKEAHIWVPNVGIVSWLAFLGYINNQPDLFDIISVTEDEVVVHYQGELQRHHFDFDRFGTDFLTSLAQSECFKSITISVSVKVNLHITICAAAYTFDLFVTEDNLLGNARTSFDIDVPFDSDRPFDADDIDPFTDGWLGLSLTGRFEQDLPDNYCLDTFVMPSTLYIGDVCCYIGHYVQIVENQSLEVEANEDVLMVAFIQEAMPWTLQSLDLTRWDIKPDVNGNLVATSGSTRVPDSFKVTKPDLTEAAFAITNAGVLQVLSPPPGGEFLKNEMYLLGTGAYVWDVNVDNMGAIVTDRVFP